MALLKWSNHHDQSTLSKSAAGQVRGWELHWNRLRGRGAGKRTQRQVGELVSEVMNVRPVIRTGKEDK